MRRAVAGGAVATIALAMTVSAWGAGGIAGSPHDFSTNSVWNTRKGVCSPCHTAHHTDDAQIAPLWAHTTTTGPFVPYSSPTLNATVGDPDAESLACLSCHDGTVAINSLISGPSTSGTGYVYIDAGSTAKIGPDLHNTHPVSFVYDAALAAADGGLENPTTYKIGDPKSSLTVSTAPVPSSWSGTPLTGKTIDQAMLKNHKMQCASCHDVHKLAGSAPTSSILTRISGNDANGRGSTLCRTCHIK